MSSNHLMINELKDCLYQSYNILGHIRFKDFDFDWDSLRDFLKKTKKNTFDPLDRYIIEHQDTDIYIKEFLVGVNLRNFFAIVNEFNLPLFTLIIWTNHYGIKKEIEIICKNNGMYDQPTVIESFVTNRRHASTNYTDIDINIDDITYHSLCLLGANRSHRFALYNQLKHISQDTLVLTVRGLKQ
jgi:hypothetical protein